MKELTKKVIEAGIVDRSAIKLMQLWGMELGAVPPREGMTKGALTELVEEIAELLEDDGLLPVTKETDLQLEQLAAKATAKAVKVVVGGQVLRVTFMGFWSRMKQLVAVAAETSGPVLNPVEVAVRPGNIVQDEGGRWEILSAEPRWVGDKLKYYVCDVARRYDDAEM